MLGILEEYGTRCSSHFALVAQYVGRQTAKYLAVYIRRCCWMELHRRSYTAVYHPLIVGKGRCAQLVIVAQFHLGEVAAGVDGFLGKERRGDGVVLNVEH